MFKFKVYIYHIMNYKYNKNKSKINKDFGYKFNKYV